MRELTKIIPSELYTPDKKHMALVTSMKSNNPTNPKNVAMGRDRRCPG
eukprot:CAMPEP_0195257014 /NCGR_PEP_ID=MMETSP0706-20130129/6567_1 /TAXON_ID=33640 /ORGANISM="Asterionellopsis glacialis, Strain CCMP134" /LENGTH=47 /DNA_ID= /DNA_START= /DNA_END= /DNA_ORIENTATION=